MDFDKYNIGFGITGSFCTFAKARKAVEHLCEMGANVIPIFSFNAQTCDTRFGSAKEYVEVPSDTRVKTSENAAAL